MIWKLASLLVVLGLPGVLAVSWLGVPLLVDAAAIPGGLAALQVANAVQGALVVLLAALLGATVGRKVGLSAPALSALIGDGRVVDAVRPQVLPGLAGGALGAAIITAFHAFAPETIAAARGGAAMPLAVRVLYGGITEEIIMRWGVMTLLVWVGWRVLQGGAGKPLDGIVWIAIVVSALLFGISHLPAVAGSVGTMPASAVVYVTGGNAAFGAVAGYLFWRHGLEAAIAAHVLAHVLADIVRG